MERVTISIDDNTLQKLTSFANLNLDEESKYYDLAIEIQDLIDTGWKGGIEFDLTTHADHIMECMIEKEYWVEDTIEPYEVTVLDVAEEYFNDNDLDELYDLIVSCRFMGDIEYYIMKERVLW